MKTGIRFGYETSASPRLAEMSLEEEIGAFSCACVEIQSFDLELLCLSSHSDIAASVKYGM
jgi:hypothetical protein